MGESTATQNVFVRCWKGEERLWIAYWIMGVVGNLVVVGVALLVAGALRAPILYIVLCFLWAIYATVAVFRCAKNVDWKVWGIVARVLIVLGWLSAISQLGR